MSNDTNNGVSRFFKVGDDTIIHYNYIQWIKKYEDCFEICGKPGGCIKYLQTSKVCKNTNPDGYKAFLKIYTESNERIKE